MGLQQCKHHAVIVIQRERPGYISCRLFFQGGLRLEGVLGGEDHHNEDGRQELLRQPDSVREETALMTPPLVGEPPLTTRTNYLYH